MLVYLYYVFCDTYCIENFINNKINIKVIEKSSVLTHRISFKPEFTIILLF